MARRRFFVVLVAIAMLLQASALPVSAAFAGNCETGTDGASSSYHGYLQRTRSGVDNTYFVSAISEVTVQPTNLCDPSGGKVDLSYFVAAVSIQSAVGLVQLGYGKCYSDKASSGQSCGLSPTIPADGQIHFEFTPDDQSSPFGKLGDASAFQQYNKVAIPGHTYRLRIRAINSQTSTTGDWEYCIRDKTAGETNYKCWHNDRHWNSSKLAWWGYETGNSNSQLGSSFTVDPEINMRWMQYQIRNAGTVDPNYYVVTNSSTTDCLYIEPGTGNPWPSWYHCDVISTVDVNGDGMVNDYETVIGHTHIHTAP